MMHAMIEELPITRQQYLYNIATFCSMLEETLRVAGFTSDECLEIFRAFVSAECVRCSIRVSGEELFALSQPPSAERSTAKIGRMRLGDCARKDCSGCYYNFVFTPLPQLSWTKILEGLNSAMDSQAHSVQDSRVLKWHFSVFFRSPVFARIAIVASLFSILLIVHQWRRGGRIPLVREPERFHVDTLLDDPASSNTKPFP